jgi:hypothetical protein
MSKPHNAVERSQLAVDFIINSCSNIGSFWGTSDVNQYLKETAIEMAIAKPSNVLPERYIEHVAYAINMIASSMVTSPPAAIASTYLATRFEFYFRILSGKLNGDGTWISPAAKQMAQSAINDSRLQRNRRISSVALAYKIMNLNQSQPVVQYFIVLDNALYSPQPNVVSSTTIKDIGDRIEFGRHAVGHGEWGDMSSEAIFYGLVTSLVFYNTR